MRGIPVSRLPAALSAGVDHLGPSSFRNVHRHSLSLGWKLLIFVSGALSDPPLAAVGIAYATRSPNPVNGTIWPLDPGRFRVLGFFGPVRKAPAGIEGVGVVGAQDPFKVGQQDSV